MLPIERVFGTIMGNPKPDRIPFTLTATLYGARLTNCKVEEYYSVPEKFCRGQIAVVNEFEPDIIFSPFALVKEAEAFGSSIAYIAHNAPNLKKPVFENFNDIHSLSLPDLENNPGLNYLIESTRMLAEQYKGQIPIAAICSSPTELPALLMGIEGWLDTLLFHPEEASRLMQLTSQFFVALANKLLANGASCIVTFANFSNPTILTRGIVQEKMIPVLKESYAQINGPIIFHHGGPPIIPFLDLYPQLPNLAGIVISPKDTFQQVREIVGNDLTVFGNLNGPLLWKANPKTIEKWCTEILNDRKDDAHFIFATSNADIPYDTPLENIRTIKKLFKE
jgi:uroporphyrinogen decarboxylase